MVFNVTEIPEVFGVVLGLDVEPTGALLSLFGLLVIIVTLAILEVNNTGMAIVGIAYLSFCVYMAWFPMWILILIALAVAGLSSRAILDKLVGG